MVIDHTQGFKPRRKKGDVVQVHRKKWKRPPDLGEAKLNVDGDFRLEGAGTGMVLRDHHGLVIFSACRALTTCRDATEAELQAIEEGLRLAIHWTRLNFILETDCAEASELIKETTPNTSVYAFGISAICELLRERDIKIVKVSREVNVVNHELAKLS
jgi:hypothetical protein